MIDFSSYSELALLILRLALGLIFLVYGWPKLKDLKLNAENFNMMGFKPGMFWGTSIGLLETFGGIAMILGILVPWFGILFAIEMIVGAIWKIRGGKKFSGGYDFDLILMAAALVLATGGSGLYALL